MERMSEEGTRIQPTIAAISGLLSTFMRQVQAGRDLLNDEESAGDSSEDDEDDFTDDDCFSDDTDGDETTSSCPSEAGRVAGHRSTDASA